MKKLEDTAVVTKMDLADFLMAGDEYKNAVAQSDSVDRCLTHYGHC